MKQLRIIVAVAGLVVALVGVHASQAQSTLRFNYVASTGVYSNVDRDVAGQQTPAKEALLGFFWITPRSGAFTLFVDDAGVLDGQTVTVYTATRHGWSSRCVPVRSMTTYSGFTPGEDVFVLIASDAYWLGMPRYDLGCRGHAVGGSAYVRL